MIRCIVTSDNDTSVTVVHRPRVNYFIIVLPETKRPDFCLKILTQKCRNLSLKFKPFLAAGIPQQAAEGTVSLETEAKKQLSRDGRSGDSREDYQVGCTD